MDDLHVATEPAPKPMAEAAAKDVRTSLDRVVLALRKAGVSPEIEAEAVESLKGVAAKCDDDFIWQPYGGATTFNEIDAWNAAQEKTYEVNDLSYQFQSIVDNIWRDEEDDVIEKSRKIARAAGDLETRVGAVANKSGFLDKAKSMLGIRGPAQPTPMVTPAETLRAMQIFDADEKATSSAGTFAAFKDADGSWRYIAVATNCYKDKENELFTADAHKEYVGYVDRTGDYPDLCLWHDLRTKVGKADCMYYDEDTGFRVTTGRFLDGMEDVAERAAAMPALAMSHGYIYKLRDLVNGKYKRYRTYEETILPEAKYAANEGTAFLATMEANMIPDAKRDFFKTMLGETRLASMEASLGERASTMTNDELAMAVKEALTEPEKVVPAKDAIVAPVAGPPAATADAGEAGAMVKAIQEALPGIVATGLKDALAPVAAKIDELVTWKATVDTAIADLKVSSDEKVAGMFGIRGLDPTKITAPADDNDNTIDTRAGNAIAKKLGHTKDADEGRHPAQGMVDLLLGDLNHGTPVAAGA